jgi:hypothetical protein
MPLISLLQVTLVLDQGRKGTALNQARFGRTAMGAPSAGDQ